MELLIQTFLGALILTFSFLWITVATINSSDNKRVEKVKSTETFVMESEVLIETVEYEEIDGTFPLSQLKKKGCVVTASFEEVS